MLLRSVRAIGSMVALALVVSSLAYADDSNVGVTVKDSFVPLTADDLDLARKNLEEAATALDTRLQQAPDQEQGWREFLGWDSLAEELASVGPLDPGVLQSFYTKLQSGHNGLGLLWFDDVSETLRGYLAMAKGLENPKLQSQYQAMVAALPQRLEAFEKAPTAEQAVVISSLLRWFDEQGQGETLCQAIRAKNGHANLFVEVGEAIVASGLARPIDDVSPISDTILGARIRGTGHTTGMGVGALVPSDSRAEFLINFDCLTKTDTVGYKGPAIIRSAGTANLTAQKRIIFDGQQVWSLPATSQASVDTTITGIGVKRGGNLIKKFVAKRANKQTSKAERVAADHAECQFNDRVDAEADEIVLKANDNYVNKLRIPAEQRKLFPAELNVRTTETAFLLNVLQAGPYDLAAPGPPPAIVPDADLAVRVHESMIINLASGGFAGMILKEEQIQEAAINMLGEVPEELKPDEDEEPWGITFARSLPLSVSFRDDTISGTLRGRRFAKGDQEHPGMNISVSYKIDRSGDQFKAIRQGELEIFPPGFVSGSGKRLAAREQVIRSLLERRLGKVLKEELEIESIDLPEQWATPSQLKMVQWEARDGWLVLAWQLVDAPKAEAEVALLAPADR